MTDIDPILLELYRNRFEGVADEMGLVLQRTAFSPNIKERLDFSCAVFDADARMVAQAAHIPVHLGAMPASVRAAMASVDAWAEGDIVIVNDPFFGGTHLPDLTMVSPVFAQGVEPPVFFVASRAHHADIGGMSPGSLPLSSELYQEGLILPPVKLVDAGKRNEALEAVILRNVRTPNERRGDLAAQRAANSIGSRRMAELVTAHGIETVSNYARHLQAYSEERLRNEIRKWPNGKATFEDSLDIEVRGRAKDVRVCIRVSVDGDAVTFDFEGSSPAGPHGFNAALPIAESACYYVVRCLSTDDIPMNDGCFRPVRVLAPESSVVNAKFPAAVAIGNTETSQRVVDAAFGAMAKLLPDRVPAMSQGSMNNVTMGPAFIDADAPWVYYETIGGGAGAGPGGPGLSGRHSHMTNTMNTPVEAFEQAYPIRFTRYAIRKESGGAGRFVGGDGIVREYVFDAPTRVVMQSTRRRVAPKGLNGGGNGQTGRNVRIGSDGAEHELPGQFTLLFEPGERLRIETPGGGGWGADA